MWQSILNVAGLAVGVGLVFIFFGAAVAYIYDFPNLSEALADVRSWVWRHKAKLAIVGGVVAVALAIGTSTTYVTGQFCETSSCASDPHRATSEHSAGCGEHHMYGWPHAWKTSACAARIDNQFHEAYGFQENGISYFMFGVDTAITTTLALAAQVLLVGGWWLARVSRRRVGFGHSPTPRTF